MSRVRRVLVLLCVLVFSVQCVVQRTEIRQINVTQPTDVRSPLRVHLTDGGTVVFASGARITADAVEGDGERHNFARTVADRVTRVRLADVSGVETFEQKTAAGATLALSTLAVAGTVVGGALLAVALFGSCPTVYSGDGEEDEAELFSTSIAPLFEGRDIDRLKAQAAADGRVTLEIRNEALETHYINHLQLVEVRHGAHEQVVPDADGSPIIVADMQPLHSAINRRSRDVTAVLGRAGDGRFYETEPETLDATTPDDLTDWIDVSAPVAPGTTEVALVFRLRNSLLNTVLLYDVMLGASGAGALDWMGRDLAQVSTAVELGRWHQQRAGLHVQVRQGDRYETVARIPDAGPISWRDVAAVVPVTRGQTSVDVRLSFVADHWRIDHVSAGRAREAAPRAIPLARVRGADGRDEGAALRDMSRADTGYLQTSPGQRFFAEFESGAVAPSVRRTFLLASQGYYTEWIRPSWIAGASGREPFRPSDHALLEALRRWSRTRIEFERQFFGSRVPMREVAPWQ
jgi:hypothetical protein